MLKSQGINLNFFKFPVELRDFEGTGNLVWELLGYGVRGT